MANSYTPEEIQEIFEAYNEALRTGTPISKELSTAMRDASLGVKGATAKMVADFGKMGQSATAFTKAMYEGKQGAVAMNDAIDTLTTGLEIMIALIPGMRLLKVVSILAVEGLAKFGKAAGEMGDKLYDSYSALSRVGAAGQQGMTGVYTSMQQFGYGLDELDKMLAVVKENSKNLALFSGTVVEGMEVLSDTAETIQRSGLQTQLLNMGLSVDGINRGIAGYYGQLGRLGQLQGKTQADLTAGANAYLIEMEGLTRLTGQQREEMEKQREEANMIDQFLAQIRQMGKAGDEAYKAFNILYSASPTAAKQFAASFSGFVTEQSSQLFQATGGEIVGLTAALREGRITGDQFAKSIGRAYKQTLPFQEGLALIAGANKDAFGSLQDSVNLANLETKDFGKAIGQTKPIDGLTASAVELRQKQMASRDALQDFVKLGVVPATDALNGLAGAAKSVGNSLPGAGNKPNQGGGTSGGWLRDLLGISPSKVSGGNLSGVNAELATAISGAMKEYQQLTGRSATVTSTVRDQAKQKEMYDAWVAGGRKGMPVAPPGSSKHETGNAVDISAADVNAMDQLGLLKKYGLARPVANDPVHVELAGARSGYSKTVTAAPSSAEMSSSATDRYNQMVNNNNKDDEAMQQVVAMLSEQNAILRNQLNVQEKTHQAVS